MAIEYTLILETQKGVRELAEICGGVETASDEEALPHGIAFSMAGLRCAVTIVDDRSREILQESFGIAPTVRVGFRIDKGDPAGTTATMKRAVVVLLRGVPGRAILVHNGEHAVLRRMGNRGVINQDKVNDGLSSFGDLLGELGPTWAIGPDPGPVP